MHPALLPLIFKRGQKEVRNRCVLAALTNKQSPDNGMLSEEEHRWLEKRAIGGFGIVTTAAANVTKDGQGWTGKWGSGRMNTSLDSRSWPMTFTSTGP